MPLRLGLRTMLALAALTLCLGGCADSVPELARWNPWLRKQWDEDEKFTATFHKKVEDLRALASRASSYPPDEQERYVADLAQRLSQEPSVPLRVELVRTLAAFPSPAAEQPLLNALNDHQTDVRVTACRGLGKRQTEAAMTALAQAVGSDTELDVRLAATRELGRYNDPRATQALTVALDENDAAMQRIAMDSLRNSTGKDYGHSPSAWREYLRGGSPAAPPPVSIAERLRDLQFW